jgi:hypothetical protein
LQQKIEMTAAQQAQITQFLSASLSGLPQVQTPMHSIAQHIIQPETIRTDFSNLFQSSSSALQVTVPNSSALAIAAAKAKDLLKAKNLTDTLKNVNNGESITSNGNESSQDGELKYFRIQSEKPKNLIF